MSGIPTDVQECSPSARAIYLLLNQEGALTQQAIRTMTGLGEDTVRRALSELAVADVVVERPDPSDGRRQKYALTAHLQVA